VLRVFRSQARQASRDWCEKATVSGEETRRTSHSCVAALNSTVLAR
jgi:hypothetical protein